MKSFGRHTKKLLVLLLIILGSAGTIRAISSAYSRRAEVLSEEILLKAGQLKVDAVILELKSLIKEYEQNMVFARSPYPGEILLGTTPPGHSTKLETLCSTRYDGLLKEIRIRRTGRGGSYLRINDIEITHITPRGPQTAIFNENGRVKLYHSAVFRLALPRPMRIRRIAISVGHESTGLEVYGIPFELPAVRRPGGNTPRNNSAGRQHMARDALQQSLLQTRQRDTATANRKKDLISQDKRHRDHLPHPPGIQEGSI